MSARHLHAQALQPIEIAIGEWKPYVTQYEEGYGEIPEKITAILRRMEYDPDYVFMPWGIAEDLVADNSKNAGPRATFPFRKTRERERQFIFSEQPIFKSCIRLFSNKAKTGQLDSLSISNINEISEYTIGYVTQEGGYQYPDDLADVLRRGNNRGFADLYQAFHALIDTSTVQIVPAVQKVGEELLYELFPAQQHLIGVIDETTDADEESCEGALLPVDYYFMTSLLNPHNVEFMKTFDAMHREIAQDTSQTFDHTFASIQRRAAERPSASTPEAILDTGQTAELIQGRDKGGNVYHVPRGTHVLLLDWVDDGNAPSIKAKVHILTGPYRGKVLYVDGRYVKLN